MSLGGLCPGCEKRIFATGQREMPHSIEQKCEQWKGPTTLEMGVFGWVWANFPPPTGSDVGGASPFVQKQRLFDRRTDFLGAPNRQGSEDRVVEGSV